MGYRLPNVSSATTRAEPIYRNGYDWPPRLWPTLFDFPLTDYAWIALIGLASFGVTIAGVARQRRGDGWAEVPSAQRDGFRGWLVDLFRFPCPTSSATRAQVWLDLKTNGLPVLTIGVALAIVILLVSAVSGPIDAAINADPRVSCPIGECFYARAWPPLLAPFSLFTMLFLGGNAFGIRRRQGRTYVSAFEATQPHCAAATQPLGWSSVVLPLRGFGGFVGTTSVSNSSCPASECAHRPGCAIESLRAGPGVLRRRLAHLELGRGGRGAHQPVPWLR